MTILRAIYLKGVGWGAILASTTALVLFAVLVTALVAHKLGKIQL